MTINNLDKFIDGLWDWGILQGCFGGTKIQPSDIDGLVERNGNFLVLEGKHPGVKLNQGQLMTFNSMINTGLFTVVVIWGKNNYPIEMLVMYPPPLQSKQGKASIEDLRRVVSWWFRYANKKRKPG